MGPGDDVCASVFSQLERGDHRRAHPGQRMHELSRQDAGWAAQRPQATPRKPVQRGVDGKVKNLQAQPIPEEKSSWSRRSSPCSWKTGSLSRTDRVPAGASLRHEARQAVHRFAIEIILTNPVCMIADETASVSEENNVDLFAERCGIGAAVQASALRQMRRLIWQKAD